MTLPSLRGGLSVTLHRLAGAVLLTLGLVVLVFRMVMTGGVESPNIAWMPLFGVVSALILPWRWVVFGQVVLGSTYAILALGPYYGLQVPPLALEPYVYLPSVLMAMVVATAVTVVMARPWAPPREQDST